MTKESKMNPNWKYRRVWCKYMKQWSIQVWSETKQKWMHQEYVSKDKWYPGYKGVK